MASVTTNRSTKATAAANNTNISHCNDRGERERWPVLVYRLQSHRGWEVYCDPDMESSSSKESGKKNNSTNPPGKSNNSVVDTTKKLDSNVEELTAAPRVGCIEVRKMRLRIRLFEQHAPWNPTQRRNRSNDNQDESKVEQNPNSQDDSAEAEKNENQNESLESGDYDPDIPGADGWNNNALVVRRRNTLLVSTRRGMGAIVFQFKSTVECIEFCDRLVYLNREYFHRPPPSAAIENDENNKRGALFDNKQYVNGMDQRDYYCTQMREYKRRRYSMLRDKGMVADLLDASSQNRESRTSQQCISDKPESSEDSSSMEWSRQCRRKDELLSYIVRLAHDDSFRGFVDELERGLESAPDCSGVHAGLGS